MRALIHPSPVPRSLGPTSISPLSVFLSLASSPSEGISNAWDFQEISDCQSQELRLLSGIRDIFLVKAIIDWLNLQGAKLNREVHSKATKRWRKGGGRDGEHSR